MDEIVNEFLVESNENLDRLDQELVSLEKEPEKAETLASVFRTIHTIKGTCGFLGFTQLESVAHMGENLLSKLRERELKLTPQIATALLQMVDAIREMLRSIEETGKEGNRDDAQLIATLAALQKKPVDALPTEQGEEKIVPTVGEILVERGATSPSIVSAALREQQEGDPRHIGEILVEKGAVKPQEVVDALMVQQAARRGIADVSIRVDVALLDRLMNLVGELVLARNQIVQFTNAREDSEMIASGQRLNLITSELQENVMKTRMQPIGNIWSKFPRTVRDVAAACGKEVRIEMEGKDTELDKTIIEAIKDPLTHLVRNSVDHGIEPPDRRKAAGKPATGLLLLRAYHEGGHVNVEISDDGAGLDLERIRGKAVERGLITPAQAAHMTEREVGNLIFLPGFSTASKITNVSGRGVGMDVVKTNVEKIGGTVDVQSKGGAGTTIKMKIPLTLAIIPALMVKSAGDRYAIPQVSLLELVRLEGEQITKAVERVQGALVHRLRGRLLPLVFLRRELGFGEEEKKAGHCEGVNIVVLQADGQPFGLVVDEVIDTEEIVVKPLGKRLKSVGIYAGATIMGDGKVALILDVLGLAQHASVVSETRERTQEQESGAKQSGQASASASQTLLLLELADGGRAAMPLSVVARLEEFARNKTEQVGDQCVLQYRGEILPLLDIGEALARGKHGERNGSRGPTEHLQVVVVKLKERNVGFIVEHILDVVETDAVVDKKNCRPGVAGQLVAQERVTEIVDVELLAGIAEKLRRLPATPFAGASHSEVMERASELVEA